MVISTLTNLYCREERLCKILLPVTVAFMYSFMVQPKKSAEMSRIVIDNLCHIHQEAEKMEEGLFCYLCNFIK